MKTKILFVILITIGSSFLKGCQEGEQIVVGDQNIVESELPQSLGEFVPPDDEFFEENQLNVFYGSDEDVVQKSGDAMYNTLTAAVSVFSIPTYAFRCYDNYKWGYRHVKQPDGSSCSWTSYVICTGNIAKISGRNYSVTSDQVYVVKDGCVGSKLVTSLRDYANNTDKNVVKARTISLQKSTTDCLGVFKQMMLLMYLNKTPFVTIAMSGNYTHYVTVYSIYWKVGVVGSKIYFTDSLDPDRGSFDQNVKYMDLWDFYCAMKNNSNSYYNFLELLPR